MRKVVKLKAGELPTDWADGSTPAVPVGPVRALVEAARAGESLMVRHEPSGAVWSCAVLDVVSTQPYCPGETVIVLPPDGTAPAVVLGRVRAYGSEPENLVIESRDALTLKSGRSSIDLRADGKVMIRGEDVLVRAKGTKRIRAGTVSIN